MRRLHQSLFITKVKWSQSVNSIACIHLLRPPFHGALLSQMQSSSIFPLCHSCCHCSSGSDSNSTSSKGEECKTFIGGTLIQSLQYSQPPRGSGIQPLLEYNRQWANKVAELNPDYFKTLAEAQSPQYMWIGCSDSRVPANEIVGLLPGDVFVHRNIANIVSNSDLNVLSVLQYAIACLQVEHVIITGHYGCGGVKAALEGASVGLADHWILHVNSVKRRFWKRIERLPQKYHLDVLCELNVITQVSHVLDTQLLTQAWDVDNVSGGNPTVELHGWVYGLDDGLLRPLLSLDRNTDHTRAIAEAEEAVFMRYGFHAQG
ncbi:Carbonic anhydrase [Trypanosoma melophagium]|uniref:Carbonic anhydrase n=1 Tax=Trypanosoma melophagium TaxID=715481 RepID=UPI00351AABB2|nr:Carbonic anhydrase [Trypanosoma melophagium]